MLARFHPAPVIVRAGLPPDGMKAAAAEFTPSRFALARLGPVVRHILVVDDGGESYRPAAVEAAPCIPAVQHIVVHAAQQSSKIR